MKNRKTPLKCSACGVPFSKAKLNRLREWRDNERHEILLRKCDAAGIRRPNLPWCSQ
jgi:hypothetical protein